MQEEIRSVATSRVLQARALEVRVPVSAANHPILQRGCKTRSERVEEAQTL